MIKRVAISIFNSFFYLVFLLFNIVLTYKESTEFIITAMCFLSLTLIPIARFIFNLRNNCIFHSYLSWKDVFYKIVPIFLMILSFIIYEHQKFIVSIANFYIMLIISFEMFMFIFFTTTTEIYKVVDNVYTFHLYGYDWKELNTTLELFTSKPYYIYDCKQSKDGLFDINSADKTYSFNCKENNFIMDNNIITKKTVLQFQEDYKKKLFDMSQYELDVITMWSI